MAPPNFNWNDDLSLTRKGMGPLPQAATPAPTATPAPETARTEPARYRLGTRLGRAGQVYEAQSDRYPGKLVIKLLPFAVGLAPAAVRAFTHEATRVADLRHPHVVALTTAGIMADGTPFLAMEPLSGESLEDRMARHRIFALGDVLPVVRGLASALAAAHAAGIVHREVRADNVFISDLPGYGIGFARLLDFGVSRLTAAARDAGRIVAPAAWRVLAPEQQQGSLAALGDRGWQELLERADGRTDQFALAAMTYRLLAGTEPIAGQEVGTAFERLHDDHAGRCPPAVDVVLCKALSRRPENRYDSMALFFRAFEEACADALASERSGVPAARGGHGPSSAAIPVSRATDEEETRPAISGIEAVTRPEAPVLTDAPTVVSWPATTAEPASVSGRRAKQATKAATMSTSPNSLTQQFFADGDRQEADWLKNMVRRPPVAAEVADTMVDTGTDELLDLSATYERVDDVPRRRAPMIAAGIAVALLGFGAAGWSVGLWSPVAWMADHTAPSFRQPPAGTVAAPGAPTIAPPTPAAAAKPPAPAPTLPTPPARAAAPTPPAPRAPVVVAPPPVAPRPPVAVAPPPVAPRPPVAVAPPPLAPAPIVPEQAVGPRPEPLRGMAWSTKRRKMVRSRLAAPATDSGPPPSGYVPSPSTPEVQVAPGWPPAGSVSPPFSP